MPFDNTPVKPLGRIWTLKMVVDTILQWLKQETQEKLDPEFVKTLVNVAISDTAEFLSSANSDDYGKVANFNSISSSVSNNVRINATYNNSNRTIIRASHGLTSNDVGKRIVYFSLKAPNEMEGTNTIFVIAEIERIVSNDSFTVTKPAGVNINPAAYVVFSSHTDMTIDLSDLRVINITKITESNTGEVIKTGDKEFDNIKRFPEKQNKIYYHTHGQTLYLYKGERVGNIGTLTLYYNSYPQLFTDDNSFLDIRDNYVPLVIATAKVYCLEHLGLGQAEHLHQFIDNKKKEIRENINRERMAIAMKNQQSEH